MIRNLLLLGTLFGPALAVVYSRVECTPGTEDIYQFNATLLNNTVVSFEEFRGKVLLIYNVATYCELTVPSYTQINALADNYIGTDLVILGFPCHQFGKQEPGANYDEIMNGIIYVRPGGEFDPQITLFEKIDVNGEDQSEIYEFLKSSCPYTDTTYRTDDLFYTPQVIGDINWNFEKFLLGRDGKQYVRYHPTTTTVEALTDDIDYLLSQPIP